MTAPLEVRDLLARLDVCPAKSLEGLAAAAIRSQQERIVELEGQVKALREASGA